jgi:hypothetical protein
VSAVNGWALLAGGLAAALPVAIHLLTRARGTRFILPTFRFVLEAATARRRWNRLRDWLVLALRVLAVAAIAGLFARLLLSPGSPIAAKEGRWLVLILDLSQSMEAQGSGSPPIALAQDAARKALADSRVKRADLILGNHPVFGRLSENLSALREEIGRATVRGTTFDPTAAFAAAATSLKSLSPQDDQNGEVLVLTDLQRSNWATASFAPLPAHVPVRVVDVRSDPVPPSNASILRAWTTGLVCVERPTPLVVELASYSSAPATRILQVEFENQTFRRSVTLPPQQRRQETFLVTPKSAGAQVAAFRLIGDRDALAADDSRSLAIHPRQGRRIVLLSSKPADSMGSAAYFVDRALRASSETGLQMGTLGPDRFDPNSEQVAKADLIVVADGGRLGTEAVQALSTCLSRGIPVLYALQIPADADSFVELESILGPAMTMPVAFAPQERNAAPRFMVWADIGRRPFKVFGPGLDRFTRELVLAGGLRSAPRGADEEGRVLARLSDGSAAVVTVPAHATRLTALNLPLSGPNHLAKSALVVPLLQEIAADLIEGPERARARSGLCGRAFSLPLTGVGTLEGAWAVIDEKGEAVPSARITEDRGGVLLVWSPADRLGAYRIKRGDELREAFVIGLPPEESDLNPIDARVLGERIARGRPVRVLGAAEASKPPGGGQETWPWFAGLALLCLFLELGVLKIFRT